MAQLTWRWLQRAICLPIMCAVFGSVVAQTADKSDATERQVKAAYIFKFGSYVDWPEGTFPNTGAAIRIGIVDADQLADELAQMAVGRTINGRTVTVHKLHREDVVMDVHVLFVGRSGNSRLAEIVSSVKGRPVLIVTESQDALTLGSMINLVVVDGKVRFEVAPRPAALGISARLLAAAHKVVMGAS